MTVWNVYWQNSNFGQHDINNSIAGWDLKYENKLFQQFDKNYGMEDNSWINLMGIVLNWMRIVCYHFAGATSMNK